MIVFSIIYFVIATSFLLFSWVLPASYNLFYIGLGALFSFAGYLSSVFFKRLVIGRFVLIDLFNILALTICILHFQYPFLESLGVVSSSYMEFFWVDNSTATFAIFIATAGYFYFLSGYFYYLQKMRMLFYRPIRTVQFIDKSRIENMVYIFTFFTVVLFVVHIICSGGGVFNEVYSSKYITRGVLGYILKLFVPTLLFAIVLDIIRIRMFFSNVGIIQFALKLNPFLLGFSVFFSIAFLYMGSRTLPLCVILTYIIGFSVFIKNINVLISISAIVFGVFSMAIVQEMRGNDMYVNRSDKIAKTAQVTSTFRFYEYTNSLSAVGRNLNELTCIVPSIYDYKMGFFMGSALLQSIPFAPSVLNLYGSAQFLTWHKFGHGGNHGTGTTNIADLYCDFGSPGMILFFFYGIFIALMEVKVRTTNSINYTVAYLAFSAYSVFICRSSFLEGAAVALQMLFLAWCVKWYFSRKVS